MRKNLSILRASLSGCSCDRIKFWANPELTTLAALSPNGTVVEQQHEIVMMN